MNDLPNDPDSVIDRLEEENDNLVSQLALIESVFIPSIPGEVVHRKIQGEDSIRVWREYRGLTVESLAEMARVPIDHIADAERGGPITLREAGRIADALAVTADDLFPYPEG